LVEPRQVMLESQGVGFDAVHQDHAHPGEGIIIKLADGTAGHLFPGELLLFQRGTLVIQYSGQTVHIASWGELEMVTLGSGCILFCCGSAGDRRGNLPPSTATQLRRSLCPPYWLLPVPLWEPLVLPPLCWPPFRPASEARLGSLAKLPLPPRCCSVISTLPAGYESDIGTHRNRQTGPLFVQGLYRSNSYWPALAI